MLTAKHTSAKLLFIRLQFFEYFVIFIKSALLDFWFVVVKHVSNFQSCKIQALDKEQNNRSFFLCYNCIYLSTGDIPIPGISINNSAIVFDAHVCFVMTPQVRNNRVDPQLTISAGTETWVDYPCGNLKLKVLSR